MARPRKIKTAEELGVLIDEFIMQCEDGKQYMDDYALMKYLGIAPRTLARWRANECGEYDGYGEQLEKLVSYREAVYARMVAENPKGSGGIIFLLKQPKNRRVHRQACDRRSRAGADDQDRRDRRRQCFQVTLNPTSRMRAQDTRCG